MTLGRRFFIVRLTYLKPFVEIAPFLVSHRAYLDQCVADGSLLLSGPLVPRTGGFLLMVAEDPGAIERILAGDPYALATVASYDILEFQPVKACAELSIFLEKV